MDFSQFRTLAKGVTNVDVASVALTMGTPVVKQEQHDTISRLSSMLPLFISKELIILSRVSSSINKCLP